ncbi:SMP-30/gluconolactonase/LRE family protein [Parasphingorhabdus halotolerans]|uniref:SMP-30/gluconolactonase/LRE family protein n=1 Tax=Parasphingorhabdus halotolerans TaxID=2725558 RepID=A0A6H2DQA1_9SPHN|nr:SMP-30/gluconolactonase/LRE family protein [Parasphingorhabdus halotolerans]QJB70378.1 SMP-30/gluconolactonase/LRE family protein [Parasphingorhabdus halotolerans]
MEIVAEGLRFPEGPIAMPDGSVILVEIAAQQLTRVMPDGTKKVIAKTGGGPNGAAMGPDGKIYVCNNGGFEYKDRNGYLTPNGIAKDYTGGSIQRVDPDTGAVETLYNDGDFGCVLRGPNDLQFDAHGGFWFTDHGKTDYEKRCHDIVGVFYAKADGSHLEEVIFPSENPNGIGISPDGKSLYVAETYTCRLTKFNISAPGKVGSDESAGGPGIPLYRPAGYKFFDSLAMEECGNICVATIGESGISVVSPEGELVEFVPTPDIYTTNICFGGEDMMDAWICLSSVGKLAKTRWKRPGLKLEYLNK